MNASNIYNFKQQWELLTADVTKTQKQIEEERTSIQANSPSQTEFGGCWWNRDIAKGRSLLSQRAKEINSLVGNIVKGDINLAYSSSAAFLKESVVSTKLKKLTQSLDKSIWNLICDFFMGTSRSIKNEKEKLDDLYDRYANFVGAIISQSEHRLGNSQIAINQDIDDELNFWKDRPGAREATDAIFSPSKNMLSTISSDHFRQIFLERLNQGISNI